jgi:hypothetical protein
MTSSYITPGKLTLRQTYVPPFPINPVNGQGFLDVNTSSGWFYNASTGLWEGPITGGTLVYEISVAGVRYAVHEFRNVGAGYEFTTPRALSVNYLVIAGGGSGDNGGGGAGGYRCSVPGEMSGGGASAEALLNLTLGTHNVVVGGPSQNSSFSTIVSTRGGNGGRFNVGNSGGSGGGSGTNSSVGYTGGAGTAGQGYAGGNGIVGNFPAAGGGGAGSVGGNSSTSTNAGIGGIGVTSSITGTPIIRAGGGGGRNPGLVSGSGLGGLGGGGNGLQGSTLAQAGSPNTGGGGGGGADGVNAGAGGSGIVIVRYAL